MFNNYDPKNNNQVVEFKKGGTDKKNNGDPNRSYTVSHNKKRYTYFDGKWWHKGANVDPATLGKGFMDAAKGVVPSEILGSNTRSNNQVANDLLSQLPEATRPTGFPLINSRVGGISSQPTIDRSQQIQAARDSLAIGRLPKEYADRYTPGVSEQFVDLMPDIYESMDSPADFLKGLNDTANYKLTPEEVNSIKELNPHLTEDQINNIDFSGKSGSNRPEVNMIAGMQNPTISQNYSVSDYRPSQGAEHNYYFNSKRLNKDKFLQDVMKQNIPLNSNTLSTIGGTIPLDLGDYTVGHGMDKERNLPYYSYYDDWNLDPQSGSWEMPIMPKIGVKTVMAAKGIETPDNFDEMYQKYSDGKGLGEVVGLGKGVPIYDRVYYDPNNNNQVVEFKKGGTVKKYPDGGNVADISNIPSTYNIPDFDLGGQFNDTITSSVQSYFNENPFPAFNLPMSTGSSYANANDQVTDLFKLYQNPNSQGDPYHQNTVKALSVGPNNGFGFKLGGPVQYFNDGGGVNQTKMSREDAIRELQSKLAAQGADMSHSKQKNGKFDGVMGQGTVKAMQDLYGESLYMEIDNQLGKSGHNDFIKDATGYFINNPNRKASTKQAKSNSRSAQVKNNNLASKTSTPIQARTISTNNAGISEGDQFLRDNSRNADGSSTLGPVGKRNNLYESLQSNRSSNNNPSTPRGRGFSRIESTERPNLFAENKNSNVFNTQQHTSNSKNPIGHNRIRTQEDLRLSNLFAENTEYNPFNIQEGNPIDQNYIDRVTARSLQGAGIASSFLPVGRGLQLGARAIGGAARNIFPRIANTLRSGRTSAAVSRPLQRSKVSDFDDLFGFKKGGFVPHFNEGGTVQAPEYVEIQTEKGEVLMMPNGELVNVKAKTSHKKQDKDNVSDIVPQGSYIFSDTKKMQLSKSKAGDIELGMTPVYYSEEFEEDDTMKEPTMMKYSDYFTKEKHTPAELAKMIKKKYPIDSRQGDAFAALAREENKVGRMPLLALTAALSEQKKQKKSPQQFQQGGGVSLPTMPMPQMSGNLPTPSYFSPSVYTSTLPQMPQVNQYSKGGQVPKYPIGGVIAAALPSLISGVGNFFSSRSQANNLQDVQDQALGYVDEQQAAIQADQDRIYSENTRLNGLADNAYAQQQQYLSQGTNAATAGILSQNPYVEATDYSNSRSLIAGQQQPYGRSQLNSAAYQADAPLRTLLQNSNRLGRNGDATIGNAVGSSIRNRSNLYAQGTLANNQFANQRLGQLANLESNQSQAYTTARNSTRDNQNQQKNSLAEIQMNKYNQLSGFAANDLSNRLALSGALSNSLDRNQNSLFNSYNSRLAALGLNAPISQYNANGVNALANSAGQITGNLFDYFTSGNPNGNATTSFTPAATLNGSLSTTDFTQIQIPG